MRTFFARVSEKNCWIGRCNCWHCLALSAGLAGELLGERGEEPGVAFAALATPGGQRQGLGRGRSGKGLQGGGWAGEDWASGGCVGGLLLMASIGADGEEAVVEAEGPS